MKTPKFDYKWFNTTFGKRTERSLLDISNDLTECERKLVNLRKEQIEWEIYHAKEDASLKTFVKTVFDLKGEK